MTDPSLPSVHAPELLAFRVGDQDYCVDIMSVREIRGWTPATPLPFAPAYVKGVINLRGTILPVIDLSIRLGMGPIAGCDRNVIVVVAIEGQIVGMLVDAVSDIISVPPDGFQLPPDMGEGATVSGISALALVDDRLIRVLDLDAVLPGRPADAA